MLRTKKSRDMQGGAIGACPHIHLIIWNLFAKDFFGGKNVNKHFSRIWCTYLTQAAELLWEGDELLSPCTKLDKPLLIVILENI